MYLCFCGHFFIFGFADLAALAELFLAAGSALLVALRASDHIDDDAAVVFAAFGTGAMRDTQSTTFALREAHAADGMMRTTLCRLGTIPAHSYYHSDVTIRLISP
ncbi:MAG: hypothetical protein UY70_C0014G0003 [Candidatus Kaiserbacteria bacterium GW2011_GWB1_52_6]|uniref:Uncharacterized protein n=2 Tax=Candidatus Kaiseribacteriota TaxID=1752734 RepID=A0A0G1X8A6_9BACT|nr:MAG: hypothetical protein UY67_C0011G0023 [Candidatus Kaiserbacteria bacterium GW2011_GWA2_52_12]KKW27438.1 MAG: hypothetical protein UY70_C0014G0003 [Candidatus Kaiserbacteria bacterium GW2011_GWB1_52_6]